MLSTASGGTITGAYYACKRKSGSTFPHIYQGFYAFLEQDRLVPDAMIKWKQSLIAEPPRYKLIQAFADTYSNLYDGVRFGLFWEKDDPTRPFHLQSIIFGATELYSGLTFRFQHAAFLPSHRDGTADEYVIGNGNVRLPSRYARKLRLGDIVGASSCFPGGFEPMLMPDDFLPDYPSNILQGMGKHAARSISLLDGGIYDNQGFESLLLANARNRKYAESAKLTLSPQQAELLQPTTLFLVADVSSAGKNLYNSPPAPPRPQLSPTLTQAWLHGMAWLFWIILLSWVLGRNEATRFVGGVVAGIGLVLASGLGLGIYAWKWLGKKLAERGPQLRGWVVPLLAQLTLRQLCDLLNLRVTSTFALLTSVFMRRVRSLNYERLYLPQAKPSTGKGYETLTSIIGRLVTDHERQLAAASSKQKKSSQKHSVANQLAAVYPTVLLAQAMPTTLWWQRDLYRLPAIIASAEITLCYQLLRRFEEQATSLGALDAEVQRRARLMWDVYQRKGKGFLLPVESLDKLQDPACTIEQLLRE